MKPRYKGQMEVSQTKCMGRREPFQPFNLAYLLFLSACGVPHVGTLPRAPCPKDLPMPYLPKLLAHPLWPSSQLSADTSLLLTKQAEKCVPFKEHLPSLQGCVQRNCLYPIDSKYRDSQALSWPCFGELHMTADSTLSTVFCLPGQSFFSPYITGPISFFPPDQPSNTQSLSFLLCLAQPEARAREQPRGQGGHAGVPLLGNRTQPRAKSELDVSPG